MSTAQLAPVSYLAQYAGHTRHLYAYQLRRWFAWYDSGPVMSSTSLGG
jgi:integrase/recombinase XerD